MGISIVLVDDHAVVRDGFQALLDDEKDLHVVATADDGRSALQNVREHSPDIVVMDISMAGINGVDATRNIKRESSGTQILALSIHSDIQLVDAMLKAGAQGYLHKSCASDDLIAAVRKVTEGKLYLPPDIAGSLVRTYFEDNMRPLSSAFSTLTEREREVLQLLADGYTSREAASELGISVQTVHSHRQSMMEKLGLESIADVVKYAIREGLTAI